MQTHIPDTLCYLNGEYLPLPEAKVSVLDRGFIFGDGVYEVVPVYAKKLFRFDEHMARLGRSLAKLRIGNPHSRDQWLERCRKLIAALAERGGTTDQLVYLQVTRGVAPRDHVMPPDLEPTVFMMASPMKPPSGEQRHHGVACVSARDFRWERADIKSISLLGNVLARQMSADRDAIETIMFRAGHLTEASASNVWIVHEGALLGPPKSEHVLEGHPRRTDEGAVRGVWHRLQPAADCRVGGQLRRRDPAQLRDQGDPPGDDARRRGRRPRRAARQARAGLRASLRGVPARQVDAVDLAPPHALAVCRPALISAL